MKLTAILLLAACITVSAKVKSQTVTLDLKNVPIQSVFREVIRQTGASIIYNESLFNKESSVTIDLKNVPIKEALAECLKGTSLTFIIENNAIVIKKKTADASAPTDFYNGPLPDDVVHGRVADSTGSPLDQASIEVRGSMRKRYTTNADGEFEISNLQIGDTLLVSYVGYIDRTVIYKGNNYMYIPLRASQNVLDETVVQAYGTTSRRYSVGSISTISADEIAQQPVSNVALALQGRIPGLLVTPTGGGIPGATVRLQVRGQNTLKSSPTSTSLLYDQPLIIVDGIPTATQNNNQTQLLNSFVAGNGQGGLSPLNSLNPADIESISVLKDADATAIYGSQGANGVIIITTKRGKAGKTALNVNAYTGPNSPTENLKMLNTQQYLQLRHEALNLDGISVDDPYATSQLQDLLNYDTTSYTNYVKKFFNKNPMTTDVNMSVSGGSNNDSYILSGGWSKTGYNFPGNFYDNRLTLHSGAHHSSQNHKFTLDFGTDFGYDDNKSDVSANVAQAMTLAPDYPNMLTPSGDLVWSYNGAQINNFFAALKEPYSMQTFSLNSNIKMDYEIISGLKIGILAGYNRSDNKEYSATPLSAQDPSTEPFNSADFSNSVSQTIDIEPQLNYRTYIGKGILTALLGGTYKKNFSSGSEQDGSNYPDDALLNSIEGAKTVYNYDNSSIYKYVGGFARINYVYANKYILNLTGRRDGSSNFGPNHQFGNFGSVGAGWIFSDENWFKNTLPFISFGKLAADYGTNGSDGVAAYMYQPFYKIYNITAQPQFQGTTPLIPNNLYNPDYTWASKRSLNLHIDLGFLKDRILVGAGWYQNITGNQLTSYPLPYITGFQSVVENMDAKVRDRGIEITLSTTNVKSKNFTWSTTFNISTNRNKLLAFPGLASSPYAYTYQIGKSTSTLYGFKYAGINDTTGLYQFYKGDGKTITSTGLSYAYKSQGGDMVPVGSGEPDFYGGFGNTFTYKGFSLTLFFQFSKQYSPNYMAALNGVGPGSENNIPEFVLNKIWLQPGDKNAVFQRPTTNIYSPNASPLASEAQETAQYFASSTGAYGNDTYVRLKTLSLSYQLPSKWVKAMHMSNFSVFVNAQNVLTFTNYKFGDPELPGQLYGIPTQRVVTGGLNFSF